MEIRPGDVFRCKTLAVYEELTANLVPADGKPFKGKSSDPSKYGRPYIVIRVKVLTDVDGKPTAVQLIPFSHAEDLIEVGGRKSLIVPVGAICDLPELPQDRSRWIVGLSGYLDLKQIEHLPSDIASRDGYGRVNIANRPFGKHWLAEALEAWPDGNPAEKLYVATRKRSAA